MAEHGLPVISHNFGAGQTQRIRQTVRFAVMLSAGLMLAASPVFLLFPRSLLIIFSSKKELLQIGEYALRVISLSFVPAGITIVVTSHLQGIAKMKLSVFVIVLRQVVLCRRYGTEYRVSGKREAYVVNRQPENLNCCGFRIVGTGQGA